MTNRKEATPLQPFDLAVTLLPSGSVPKIESVLEPVTLIQINPTTFSLLFLRHGTNKVLEWI